MKTYAKIISAALLMASSSIALATSSSTTTLDINVTKGEILNLIGTMSTTSAIDATASADSGTISLGMLGAESNIAGGCSVAITSANGFRLEHNDIAGLFLHDAGVYTHNHTADYSGCATAETDFSVTFPPVVATTAGTYSDTLTVVVSYP